MAAGMELLGMGLGQEFVPGLGQHLVQELVQEPGLELALELALG
jgi:hypothetical protein